MQTNIVLGTTTTRKEIIKTLTILSLKAGNEYAYISYSGVGDEKNLSI